MKDNNSNQIEEVKSRLIRLIMNIAGTFFLGLGIVGVFLPILPTTPFLLLSAACYARGSKRFYNWLMNNKIIGKYIRNYREGRGIPLKVKILSISFLWIAILFSAFFVDILVIRIILILIAIGVTIHVLTIRTLKD